MKKLISMAAVMTMLFAVIAAAGMPVSAQTAPYVESDTTVTFTKSPGDSYWFKFTIHGTHEKPRMDTGNSSVLKAGTVKKSTNSAGEDVYLFQIFVVGKPGDGTGVYTTLPGQKSVAQCVVNVGSSTSFPTFSSDEEGELLTGTPSKPSASDQLTDKQAALNAGLTLGDWNDDYARQVFDLTNKKREKAGLEPYDWDEDLYKDAKVRAKEISVKYSHERPDNAVGNIDYAENIACGSFSASNASCSDPM